ncbi:MAG: hypothetical protein ACLFU7_02150 [Armatimonadota bacterium]
MAERVRMPGFCHLPVVVLPVVLIIACTIAPASAGSDRPVSAQGLGGLLSTPMPGTQARESAELADRLEHTLSGFAGVDSVTAIVSPESDDGGVSPQVGVGLTLDDDFAPTPDWLEAVCVLSLRTIPDLAPDSLTIVDSSGRILHDEGVSHLPEIAPPPDTGVIDETFLFQPWWLWAAAGVGFVLVIAGVAAQLPLRRDTQADDAAREPGPLDFLDGVPEGELVRVLAAEREEIVRAVFALAPEAVVERLRRDEALVCEARSASTPPDSRMVAALAAALRARLVRS